MFPFFLALYNGSQVSIVALWATCLVPHKTLYCKCSVDLPGKSFFEIMVPWVIKAIKIFILNVKEFDNLFTRNMSQARVIYFLFYQFFSQQVRVGG